VYALVFDRNFFGGWETNNDVSRFAFFVHELSHVNAGYKRWLEVGSPEFFSKPKFKQEWLDHLAITIWEEYEADRQKFQFLSHIADESGGRITDSHTLGLAQDLENLLGDLPICVNQWKTDYKEYRLSDGELCFIVSERLSSILVLWAHVVSGVYVIGDIKKKVTAIENLEGYKQFFSNNLKNIRSTLEYLHSKKRYSPEKIKYISNQIEGILTICGFEAYDSHSECKMKVIEKE
jgi:hypothetical protein